MSLVSIAALMVSLAVLRCGTRRLVFGSFTGSVMSIVELLGIVVASVSLRWIGLGMFRGASAILHWPMGFREALDAFLAVLGGDTTTIAEDA
jgi:hypothetical protein